MGFCLFCLGFCQLPEYLPGFCLEFCHGSVRVCEWVFGYFAFCLKLSGFCLGGAALVSAASFLGSAWVSLSLPIFLPGICLGSIWAAAWLLYLFWLGFCLISWAFTWAAPGFCLGYTRVSAWLLSCLCLFSARVSAWVMMLAFLLLFLSGFCLVSASPGFCLGIDLGSA